MCGHSPPQALSVDHTIRPTKKKKKKKRSCPTSSVLSVDHTIRPTKKKKKKKKRRRSCRLCGPLFFLHPPITIAF
jgi:hypothetical protein